MHASCSATGLGAGCMHGGDGRSHLCGKHVGCNGNSSDRCLTTARVLYRHGRCKHTCTCAARLGCISDSRLLVATLPLTDACKCVDVHECMCVHVSLRMHPRCSPQVCCCARWARSSTGWHRRMHRASYVMCRTKVCQWAHALHLRHVTVSIGCMRPYVQC